MTEHQVLTIALVPSANNYARALADWAYGSEANFLPVASAWLTAQRAHVDHADGLHRAQPAEHQHADRPDRARQARAREPDHRTAGQHQDRRRSRRGHGQQHQPLLGVERDRRHQDGHAHPGVAAVLQSARPRRHVITLIGVVLDGPNHPTIDTAITTLVDQARAGFHLVTVAAKGQVVRELHDAMGDPVQRGRHTDGYRGGLRRDARPRIGTASPVG